MKTTGSTDKKPNMSGLRNKLSEFAFSKNSTPEKPAYETVPSLQLPSKAPSETLSVEKVCSLSFSSYKSCNYFTKGF